MEPVTRETGRAVPLSQRWPGNREVSWSLGVGSVYRFGNSYDVAKRWE
jgi:hypothetical protein